MLVLVVAHVQNMYSQSYRWLSLPWHYPVHSTSIHVVSVSLLTNLLVDCLTAAGHAYMASNYETFFLGQLWNFTSLYPQPKSLQQSLSAPASWWTNVNNSGAVESFPVCSSDSVSFFFGKGKIYWFQEDTSRWYINSKCSRSLPQMHTA